MAKKFERMENVLLMEAKEVKGIKDRINEIDDVIAKKYINNKSDIPFPEQGADKPDSDLKEEMLPEPTPPKTNDNDTVRVLPHRFRSKVSRNHINKPILLKEHQTDNLEKKARDLQLKLRSMGDDSKTMPELVKMIKNSSSSFVQTDDVIASFKNKFDSELKKNLTKQEKIELDSVTKMGYKAMPSLSMLKKNMKHYNEMFMNFRQKEGTKNNIDEDIKDDSIASDKKGKIRLTKENNNLEDKGSVEDYGKSG